MLVFAAALSLTACDQVSESVSDFLRPPSAAEIGVRVTDLAGKGQVDEALRKGEAFLAKNPDPEGHLHRALAQVYLERGDAQRAAQHLLQAPAPAAMIQSGEASSPAAPPAPGGDAVGRSTTANAAPTTPAAVQAVSAEVDGASARLTSNGIEVRAGDASATLPK